MYSSICFYNSCIYELLVTYSDISISCWNSNFCAFAERNRELDYGRAAIAICVVLNSVKEMVVTPAFAMETDGIIKTSTQDN
jgi:hypothetical protein